MKLLLLFIFSHFSLNLVAKRKIESKNMEGQTPFTWPIGQRSVWCGPPDFKWKEKGVKLMADCEILKDQMKVWVNELTDRTECIKSIFLVINGEQMPTWQKAGSSKPYWIKFDNTISNRTKMSQSSVTVTVTARNPNAGHEQDFSTQFTVKTTNCKPIEGNQDPGDDDSGAKTSDEGDIIIPLAAVLLVLLIIVVTTTTVVLQRKNLGKPKRGSTDLNDTYGTYARGWDGEGEYGEGDKVYVTDTNTYYSAD